jgi:hypothetical protein
MSEVRLNLIDSLRILQGTIHGSVVDACVAALSAEPETIAEPTPHWREPSSPPGMRPSVLSKLALDEKRK